MPITLQGVASFDSSFARRLPRLEAEMTAHGLAPSDFVISKSPATTGNVPFLGPFFYDYTVFIGDTHFTVTEPNDARFLEYFHKRVLASDAPESEIDAAPAAARPDGMLKRLSRWMMQPI